MSLSHCPKCGNPLNPPDGSDHQTCRSCNWSSDPTRIPVVKTDESSFSAAVLGENYTLIASALCHASILGSFAVLPIIIPLAFLYGSNHEIIRANAREAVNFQINSFILLLCIFVLTGGIAIANLTLSGLLLFALLVIWGIGNMIYCYIAVIQSFRHPDVPAKYALIYRFVK